MAKKRARRSRLEPADVLQTRMEYYTELARKLMKEPHGSREKIEDYLKLAQDAAKELAPYRHGRAQGGDSDEPKKHHVIRVGDAPTFANWQEWQIYYQAVEAKLDAATVAAGGDSLKAKMKALLERFQPTETAN